ncbi:class I SAM-dependent methyltransferase [Anaerosporobacter faecicola]|uniref:class I SAM-dependent methyltransferase n=1 Tax=Anaerosporobacter faecicola TaxID=2718714 RepID=UPI001438B418|nr:class I SAM-dependent methyltransferase [Anaerosporobacter faecicola]
MNSQIIYRFLAKFYDLLDVTYFRKKEESPRRAVMNQITDSDRVILDLCTGTGANALTIAKEKRHAKLYGVDLSTKMLQIAKEKKKKEQVANLKFMEMDATNLTFEKESFDVALLSLVLHEIKEDLAAKILMEAKRVLKKEGKLIVVEWEQPKSLLEKIAFLPIHVLEPRGFHHFLYMDIYEYFEKHGFTVTEKITCKYSKVLILQPVTTK